jgi:hypothetical protein
MSALFKVGPPLKAKEPTIGTAKARLANKTAATTSAPVILIIEVFILGYFLVVD